MAEHNPFNSPLNSEKITLETFHRLLRCYETTVSQVHRRKITLKLQSKPAKGSKRKANTQATDPEPSDSEESQILEQLNKILELDRWRYETLPKTVHERARNACGIEEQGGYLLKEDLVDIMEWKMKHGVFRPALKGMIKSIPENVVRQSTSSAFASLPYHFDPISAPHKAFPKISLDELTTPLRGVGPATASLILSIGTGLMDAKVQVPFYSDDVYLWVVLNEFLERDPERPSPYTNPSGQLKAKYNLMEYRDLWDAVQQLRKRLNTELGDFEPVSLFDIEKVAYVIRHIDVSGYAGHGTDLVSEPVDNVASKDESQGSELDKKQKSEAHGETSQAPRRESKRLKK